MMHVEVDYNDEFVLFYHEVCCGTDQALSHEVAELKNEKMKVQSGLVTFSDADSHLAAAAEKKVNGQTRVIIMLISY